LECAIGLKDGEGRYYGLKDSDPTYKNVGGLPMNTQIRVSGMLKKESSTTYPTVGTIEVSKITREWLSVAHRLQLQHTICSVVFLFDNATQAL